MKPKYWPDRGTLLATVRTITVAAVAATGFHASADVGVTAQRAEVLRKNLRTHVPGMRTIDEVRATPLSGVFEIRVGTEILYADAQGQYVIQGQLLDAKARRNLTEERIEALTAVRFEDLPLEDAFVIRRGDGKRKLAVFEDPNCGYCRRFEADLQKVDNVTVYVFLYPILGADSVKKAGAHWCAPDRAAAWQEWMLRGRAVSTEKPCDVAAISRNVRYGQEHRLTSTPTLIFQSGVRIPGAMSATEIESRLSGKKSQQSS